MQAGPNSLDSIMHPAALRIRELSLEVWPDRPVELVGKSPAMEQLLQKVNKFARFDEPILILGETGTGKELIARACFLAGPRRKHKFVAVSCPQHGDGNLTTSELFGHKKGSFTGATSDRKGFFETADGGVIFLDEIADLPLSTQVMLLRALAEGEFRRVGESETRRVSTRVVAATNRKLKDLVVQKEFRHDLYFRLSYFPLYVPPLRERGDDWKLIAEKLLSERAARFGEVRRLSPDAVARLSCYHWPGNVRQLESVVKFGYSASDTEWVELEHVESALDWAHERILPSADVGLPVASHDFPESPHSSHAFGEGNRTKTHTEDAVLAIYAKILAGHSFWELVHAPYLNRDLNNEQIRCLLEHALARCGGTYTSLLKHFGLPENQYQRFMDFLRTHNLKLEGEQLRSLRRAWNAGPSGSVPERT